MKWVHQALGEMLSDPPAAHFLQWLNGAIMQENDCNLTLFVLYYIRVFAEMQWLPSFQSDFSDSLWFGTS